MTRMALTPKEPSRLLCSTYVELHNGRADQILSKKYKHFSGKMQSIIWCTKISMTSLRPKIFNQPLKIFLSHVVSWVKVVKNGKLLTFKVTFLWQKLSESLYLFSLKNMILGAHFLLLTFFENFNFQTTLFSKMTSNFWRLLLNWAQDLKTF